MKYTIKNIISLFFFSITMRVVCFVYKYMSEESQKEIGAIFESGLTSRALDATDETLKVIGNATYCRNCGHWLWRESPRQ